MSFTDPIGDMLTRIRNAQMRRRDTVSTPASTLRGRVLDVLKSEGFIRGYSESKHDNGLAEFEIELKYSDNVPVIRTIERVSRPGRRVYASVKNIPSVANRPWRVDPVDPQGRDGRPRSEVPEYGWRGTLPRLLARQDAGVTMTPKEVRECPVQARNRSLRSAASPSRSTIATVKAKGPKGELVADADGYRQRQADRRGHRHRAGQRHARKLAPPGAPPAR